MKKFAIVLIAAVVAMAISGCAGSGAPDFSKIAEDQGVIMPAVIFGQKGKVFDAATYQFDAPKPIAVDSKGNIFVAGKAFDLTKYSSDGKYLATIGEKGEGKGQWKYPKGLAVTKDDDLVVADSYGVKMLIYDKEGKLIREFGEPGDAPHQIADLGPCAVDKDKNIYVSDEGAVTGIKKYTFDGKFVSVFVPVVDYGVPGTKELAYHAIDDELGRLYAGDDGDGDIDVYDLATGKYLFSFAGHGPDPGQITEDIDGIAVGPYNLVFAVDGADGTIQVYTSEGKYVTQWGKAGIYEGEMAEVEGIAYDAVNNRIVIADEKNYRVQSFALKDIGL